MDVNATDDGDGNGETTPLDQLEALAEELWRQRDDWLDAEEIPLDTPGAREAREAAAAIPLDDCPEALAEAWRRWSRGADAVGIALILEGMPTLAEDPDLAATYIPLLGLRGVQFDSDGYRTGRLERAEANEGPNPPVPLSEVVVRPAALQILRVLEGCRPDETMRLLTVLNGFWSRDERVGTELARLLDSLVQDGAGLDWDGTSPLVPAWSLRELSQRATAAARPLSDLAAVREAVPRMIARFRATAPQGDDAPGTGSDRGSRGEAATLASLRPVTAPGADAVQRVPPFGRVVDQLRGLVTRPTGGLVILVGEPGSGRGTVIRMLAESLAGQKGLVSCSPLDLLAGASYVNEGEGRLRTVLGRIRRQGLTWVVPDFETVTSAGRSSSDPTSIGDWLAGALAQDNYSILGETTPDGVARLAKSARRLWETADVVHMPELTDDELLLIGRHVLPRTTKDRATGAPDGPPPTTPDADAADALVTESIALSSRLLPRRSQPGGMVSLLEAMAVAARDGATGRDALIEGAISATGLPRGLVDPRVGIRPDDLRAALSEEVMGQPEAVEALVGTVASITSNLTNPKRPFGVLLFAGPTGTGKTELVKVLAREVFGSEKRLFRIDMSELGPGVTFERILGSGGEGDDNSLAAQVRAEPFCVVLLDEFEKAAPIFHDLLLSLFDEGRLTDSQGRTVDFRHAIIVATSNLGASLGTRPRLGFERQHAVVLTEERLQLELTRRLRPELVNRFDRVVPFAPLSRDVMRRIVRSGITSLLRREGFGALDWAVEVDESAVDFLLEKGFTEELGARPLARAIDRYLTKPVAISIASGAAPTGSQFLLVSAGEKTLTLRFVDADPPVPTRAASRRRSGPSLTQIARDPEGTEEELELVAGTLARCVAATEEPTWRDAMERSLAHFNKPGFWERTDRDLVLERIEASDRILAEVRDLSGSLDRAHASGHGQTDRPELARLARRVLQLASAIDVLHADTPQDALIVAHGVDGPDDESMIGRLHRMYGLWAEGAGGLVGDPVTDDSGTTAFVVSALGASRTLRAETGIHVWESTERRRRVVIAQVRLVVIPWAGGSSEQIAHAVEASGSDGMQVARRYREKPSPLVRDLVRGYKTGRLRDVLDGDFDLFP